MIKLVITSAIIVLSGVALAGCTRTGNASLFLSQDGGQSFGAQSQLDTEDTLNGRSINSFDVGTSNIYAGFVDDGLVQSRDGGLTWSSTALNTGTVNDLAVDPVTREDVYVARDQEVLRSTGQGQGFKSLYADPSIISALTIDPVAPTNIWIGTEAGQVLMSENSGRSWSVKSSFKSPISDIFVSPLGSAVIVGTEREGLFISADKGETFLERKPKIVTEGSFTAGVESIESISQSEEIGSPLLVATPNFLYSTSDLGRTWTEVEVPLVTDENKLSRALAHPTNSSLIVITAGNTVATSSDSGRTWVTRSMDSDRTLGPIAFPSQNSILIGITGAGVGFIEESLR